VSQSPLQQWPALSSPKYELFSACDCGIEALDETTTLRVPTRRRLAKHDTSSWPTLFTNKLGNPASYNGIIPSQLDSSHSQHKPIVPITISQTFITPAPPNNYLHNNKHHIPTPATMRRAAATTTPPPRASSPSSSDPVSHPYPTPEQTPLRGNEIHSSVVKIPECEVVSVESIYRRRAAFPEDTLLFYDVPVEVEERLRRSYLCCRYVTPPRSGINKYNSYRS